MAKTESQPPRLLDELRASRKDIAKTVGPGVLVTLIGLIIALYFVEPPPPRELIIAAGPRGGSYYEVAQRYAKIFADNGVRLVIRETAGSIENYDQLIHDEQLHVAIVQGGTAPQDQDLRQLQSLATLYPEPLWVFYRKGITVQTLSDLSSQRVSVGAKGSGTRALVESLLKASGLEADNHGMFQYHGPSQSIRLLREGEIDVAFMVLSAGSPLVAEMLGDPNVELFSFSRNKAYAMRCPFLSDVVLNRGVVDLEGDLPASDVQLIAPIATLVASEDLHDAFVPLLMEAATRVHQSGDLISPSGVYPATSDAELPPNPIAQHYLRFGPSFLEQYLGFWIASLVDRAKIMIVPLVVLMLPLVKLAPPVYRWRIRSRIYRWYALLRGIDQSLRDGSDEQLREHADKLARVEKELQTVNVPLSYMEEFYQLRLHIDLVNRRLRERIADLPATESTSKEQDD